jgi:hypothetical protein
LAKRTRYQYGSVEINKRVTGPDVWLYRWWEAAAKTAAQPTQLYMPLPVTDMKGKPLTFTIAETKKPTTTTAANPASATCATPCLLPACTVACPTTTQTAAPKNP